MLVFYDPNNDNQVMAFYTFGTSSEVWESRGYLRAKIMDPEIVSEINRDGRDCRIIFEGDQVTHTAYTENMVKPGPDTFVDDDDIDEVS